MAGFTRAIFVKREVTLQLYGGGTKTWSDGELLDIYLAMLLGDSALAYAGNIGYIRVGSLLAAVDADAPYNCRLLEQRDAICEPAHVPPLEFRAGTANKTLDQALVDSGYAGPLPVVLAEVYWAVFEVTSGRSYVATDSNLVLEAGVFGGRPARLRTLRRAPT